IIVGRNDTENKKLKEIAEEGDTLIEPDSFAGPSALICGENIEGMNEFAASVIMRYAKNKSGAEETLKSSHGGKTELFNSTPIADDSLIDKVRVC
ncbi:MAG: hypothetical protein KAR06_12480, partial [Deltaproteobacteria bacterium]|nr:hypothetical protein [Deltaproteobacteria bacterium]